MLQDVGIKEKTIDESLQDYNQLKKEYKKVCKRNKEIEKILQNDITEIVEK